MRQAIYDTLRGDIALNGMGVAANGTNLYPNFAADSPAGDPTQQLFVVIQYGATEAPPAPGVSPRALPITLWVYNRQPNFEAINGILLRARVILPALAGTRFSGGAFLGVDFSFSSSDQYDDVYGAANRSDTYRVVASGV